MCKPSWDDAPEWANYMAMDECGEWWWYECEPIEMNGYWTSSNGNRMSTNLAPYLPWRESSERRP